MTDRETILVVDDEREVGSLLREFLEREGFSVVVASTGEEARSALRSAPVALALLDLLMPDMAGVDLMREVLSVESPPEVVIITGHGTLDSAIAAVEAGASGYILKPVDLRRLRALIGKVLEHRRLTRENVRLYERAEREHRQLRALYDASGRLAAVHDADQILSLIVEDATRLLGIEAAAIRLLEGEELVLAARTESAAAFISRPRLRVGESLSGLVVTGGEPVVVEDLTTDTRYDPAHKRGALELGFHGFLGVPLRAHGRIIGTLNAYTKRHRLFTPDETSLLSALADQASLAIEKARLLRETEAREQEATKLYEITGQLASSLDVRHILDLITAKAVELLGSDTSGVFVSDAASGGFRVLAGLQLENELTRNLALTLGESIAWRAFKERRVVWTRDRLADPSLQYAPLADSIAKGKAPRAYLAAPMHSRGEVYGVLMVYFFAPHDFTPKEVRLLCTLARHAAIAIDNSRLFEEAQTQRTRLTQIFDSTSDGFLLVGRDGQVVSANRRTAELLSLNEAGVVGRDLVEVLAVTQDGSPDWDLTTAAFRSLVEDPDRGSHGDLTLPAGLRVLEWVGQPTKDASGTTVGLTLTLRDVTQEREVSQMKSDFVSFVTHQLRTPLSGIKWLLELAIQEPQLPAETQSYIQDARESAERLTKLVNELLDISRLESGKLAIVLQETKLGELTQGVLDEASVLVRERGHRLSVTGGETIPPVLADPQLLRQVILNLVSNAVKYTLSGGEIAISMSGADGVVEWAIRDSGIGIPKQAQRRLFEKFYRADNVTTIETEGTGLGLYLVRLILGRLGGRIWCESEEGKGTTFRFTLPRVGREREVAHGNG